MRQMSGSIFDSSLSLCQSDVQLKKKILKFYSAFSILDEKAETVTSGV